MQPIILKKLLKKIKYFLPKHVSIWLIYLLLLSVNQSFSQTSTAGNNQEKTTVQNIRIWNAPDHTRLVFDLSASAKFKTFALDNPKRFIVDIANGASSAKAPNLKNNPRLASLRHGDLNAETYRYVLEVRQAYKVSAFQLDPNKLYGYRLVIDLFDINPANSKDSVDSNSIKTTDAQANTSSTSTENGANSSSNKSAQSNTARDGQAPITSLPPTTLKKRKLIVAIDAGHGGEDPGAIGYKRLREKHIVLSISKMLQKIINQDPNMSAFLTRKGDYFVRLRNRTNIARKKQADLFVSIHADAFSKKTASGFSVFALSQRGASSELARTLARKENAADLIGGVSIKDKDDVLAQVLLDLSMTKNISEGVEFGNFVLKELGKLGKLHGRRVEQAGFAVLKSPDIPSILVETGFITNPAEAKRLNTKSFQKKIAKAIYTAISNYSRKNPVFKQRKNLVVDNTSSRNTQNNSRSAVPVKKARIHKVKRGEFLASIAKKYGVSVANLRKWNRLKSSKIFVGQTLRVNAATKQTQKNSSNSKQSKIVRYKVRRGDNLSTIAERYGVSMRLIQRENAMKNGRLLIGQVLKIPVKSNALEKEITSSKQTTKRNKTVVHIVKRGQTLSGIADRYKVKMSVIKRDNKLKKSSLRIGQKLTINTTQTVKKQTIHKVRSGENLSLIAKRYGVSVASIKQKNRLKSSKLFVGQKLKI